MSQTLAVHERKKYEKAWAMPEYHNFSPGVAMLPMFKQMHDRQGMFLIDIGCGAGAASEKLVEMGWNVTMIDHVEPKPRFEGAPFIKQNLWAPWKKQDLQWYWDQGFCCDVMEHIPLEKVDAVLDNIFSHCERVFFSICFTDDHFGKRVGHPLHLTVRPFMWWFEKLAEFGKVKQARDLLGEGVFDVVAG